ncbi:MAG: hypothetical protein CMJ19_01150 [Phycisphaeraceae bacterium]|nr:hypothetical protein [Phycisphaeraceae bacterium]
MHYWFRAKRYGWGWSMPATWQGWVFTFVWSIVTIPAVCWVANHSLPWAYVILTVMSALLLIVLFMKGEPPRWRWGSEE